MVKCDMVNCIVDTGDSVHIFFANRRDPAVRHQVMLDKLKIQQHKKSVKEMAEVEGVELVGDFGWLNDVVRKL